MSVLHRALWWQIYSYEESKLRLYLATEENCELFSFIAKIYFSLITASVALLPEMVSANQLSLFTKWKDSLQIESNLFDWNVPVLSSP